MQFCNTSFGRVIRDRYYMLCTLCVYIYIYIYYIHVYIYIYACNTDGWTCVKISASATMTYRYMNTQTLRKMHIERQSNTTQQILRQLFPKDGRTLVGFEPTSCMYIHVHMYTYIYIVCVCTCT